jgi:hypothetical protein
MTRPDELNEVRERVRTRYAAAATTVTEGGVAACGDTCKAPDETGTGAELYGAAEQGPQSRDAVLEDPDGGLQGGPPCIRQKRRLARHTAGGRAVQFRLRPLGFAPSNDSAAVSLVSGCLSGHGMCR